MIQEIQLAIGKMIEDINITPNTIKMHPADLYDLKNHITLFLIPATDFKKPLTIFGLKIIEDEYMKKGTCLIYDDKYILKVLI